MPGRSERSYEKDHDDPMLDEYAQLLFGYA